MSSTLICAEDHRRILDFLREYRPALQADVEQIEILKRKLHAAAIVPQSDLPRQTVSMYSTVRVADLRDRTLRNFTLVYPYNASGGYGRVSILSPFGTALLGCSAGDTFDAPMEGDPRGFAIREVLYQPEWDERNRFAAMHRIWPN